MYNYNPTQHRADPAHYHPSWPHMIVVDPAASGKAGVMFFAHKPGGTEWFIVRGDYVSGAAASDLLDEIDEMTAGYNIIRRVSDPHEAWFIKEGHKRKQYYLGVPKKNERKKELIKNLQEALNDGKIKLTGWVPLLVAELESCMWKEGADDKIIGSSRFHLLDCAQYGVDMLPKIKDLPEQHGWQQQLKLAHRKQVDKRANGTDKVKRSGRIVARRGRMLKRC